jgi:hypothetical protein
MTISEIIEQSAKENGVNPNDPVFRAKLMKELISIGYFKETA